MVRRNSILALCGAVAALAIVVIAVVIVLTRGGGRDAFTSEQVKEIAAIKAEAEYPSKLIVPQTRPTQPVVVATTQQVNPFEVFQKLMHRADEPSPRPSPGVPVEGGMPAATRPTTQASTQPLRGLTIAPIPPP